MEHDAEEHTINEPSGAAADRSVARDGLAAVAIIVVTVAIIVFVVMSLI